MTQNHTSGPWVAKPGNSGLVLIESGEAIAQVISHGDLDQFAANTRLVAAAPKLLAALEEMARIAWSMRVANNNAGCNNAHFQRLAECEELAHIVLAAVKGEA